MSTSRSPFFDVTRMNGFSSSAPSAANAESKPAARPAGTRTVNESFGGVMPRRIWGFRPTISSVREPVAVAMAASGVVGPTRTVS